MIFQKRISFALLAFLMVASQMQGVDGNVHVNSTNTASWAKQKVSTVREKAYDAYAFTREKAHVLYEKAKEYKKFIAGVVATAGIAGVLYKLHTINQAMQNAVNQANNFQQQLNIANQNLNIANQAQQDAAGQLAIARINNQQEIALLNEQLREADELYTIVNQELNDSKQELSEVNALFQDMEQLSEDAVQEVNALRQERDAVLRQLEQLQLRRIEKVSNPQFRALVDDSAAQTINADDLNDVKYVLLNEQLMRDVLSKNTSAIDKVCSNVYSKLMNNYLSQVLADSLNKDNSIATVITQQMCHDFNAWLANVAKVVDYQKNPVLLLEGVKNNSDISHEIESVVSSDEDSCSWELDLSSDDEGCNIF